MIVQMKEENVGFRIKNNLGKNSPDFEREEFRLHLARNSLKCRVGTLIQVKTNWVSDEYKNLYDNCKKQIIKKILLSCLVVQKIKII